MGGPAERAWLGWVDRLGGGALGAAEGALVSALVIVSLSWLLGPAHELLAESRSLAAFERLQEEVAARGGSLPDVASGPRR